jgi:hypothetical protein
MLDLKNLKKRFFKLYKWFNLLPIFTETRLQVLKVICHCDNHDHLYEKHLNLIMIQLNCLSSLMVKVRNNYRAKLQGQMQGKL